MCSLAVPDSHLVRPVEKPDLSTAHFPRLSPEPPLERPRQAQKDGTQALFNGTEASQAGPKKPVCLTLNL
jgi:hypothetical protein